jgi:hypothetical protein
MYFGRKQHVRAVAMRVTFKGVEWHLRIMMQRTSGVAVKNNFRTRQHAATDDAVALSRAWGICKMFHSDPWSLARVGKELGIGEFELLEIYRRKGIDN